MPELRAPYAELLERLGSPERSVQRAASEEATQRLATDPGLAEALNELLRDGAPHARFAAAFALFHAGRHGLRLLAPLLDSLSLDDGDLRWSAVHVLALLGRMQPEVAPVLLHEASHAACARRRRMALYALRELAPERVETQRAMLAALDDPDADVRRAAFTSLAKLHEPARAALERALSALESDPDPRMRRIAAVLIPELVRHHPEAAGSGRAALERAARDRDPALARAAAAALVRL